MAELGPQRRGPALVGLELAHEALPARLREPERVAGAVEHLDLLELAREQEVLELGVGLDVQLAAALLGLVQRRLGQVHVALVDQVGQLAEQEGQDQRADVRAVDVGVAHDDDLVVPQLLEVELLADAGADRRDQRLDLVVGEDLVDAVLLGVDDLAAQGQDRLDVAVAALLGRAAGRVALDHEQLGQGRVPHRAVGELARQVRVLERGLAPREIPRLARCLPSPCGLHALVDDQARLRRILLEKFSEPTVHGRLHEALDRRVAELGLRLPLELRVGELDRDDRGQALADVIALEVVLLLLQQPLLARIGVQRAGQGRAEAAEVRAALVGVDVVGEREQVLLERAVPLERHLDLADVVVVDQVDDLAGRSGPSCPCECR